jgi:hypothetical protein
LLENKFPNDQLKPDPTAPPPVVSVLSNIISAASSKP